MLYILYCIIIPQRAVAFEGLLLGLYRISPVRKDPSPSAPERVDLASLPQPWADGRSSLQIYLASGKLKHARDFWLLPSTQQVSWGKTLRAKKCKTERLASVVAEPKIRHAKELFEEMDDDQSGYLDDKE